MVRFMSWCLSSGWDRASGSSMEWFAALRARLVLRGHWSVVVAQPKVKA